MTGYRAWLDSRGVPRGPWVRRDSDTSRMAETNEDSARGEAEVARAGTASPKLQAQNNPRKPSP